MEEILASIRRIISEEELTPPPVHAQREAPTADEDDVLELTQRADDAKAPWLPAPHPEPAPPPHNEPLQTHEALVMSELEPEPSLPAPPIDAVRTSDDPLVSAPAAGAVASAFGALERSVGLPADTRTLEDLVREMLRPMLKTWLEEHLPAIVTAQVAAEVERISRQRR